MNQSAEYSKLRERTLHKAFLPQTAIQNMENMEQEFDAMVGRIKQNIPTEFMIDEEVEPYHHSFRTPSGRYSLSLMYLNPDNQGAYFEIDVYKGGEIEESRTYELDDNTPKEVADIFIGTAKEVSEQET